MCYVIIAVMAFKWQRLRASKKSSQALEKRVVVVVVGVAITMTIDTRLRRRPCRPLSITSMR